MRKNKNTAAFRIGDTLYISLDATLDLIDMAGANSVKEYERQAKEALQERLDEGAEVNVRLYKSMVKERAQNLRALVQSIKGALDSLRED